MFSKKSIRFKLNMFVMAITFAIVCIGCVTAISIFFRIYEEDAAKNVSSAINSMETVVITSNEKKMSDFVDELAYISTEILDSKEMDSSQLFSKLLVHDSLMDLEFVQVISEGKIIAEDILCKPSVLTLALSDAPEAINTPVVWINGNPDTGIHIFAASPIRTSDGALTGLVVAGMLASSTEYTEYIRNTANMDATIFAGNLRFATSVKKHGKLQVGTELDPKIASIVLENGLEFQGKAQILEIPYITAYRPIKDHNGRTVGALFVGKSLSSLYIVRNRIISYIMLLGIVLLLLFYLISNRWLFRNVISPVLSVSAAVKTISEGNYSPVGGDHSKSGTEISSLYSSINSMAAEISSSKAKLESIAYYDSLTGLFNREFMYQKHKNVPLANNAYSLSILFYIDVDNLKYINNLFGHRFGDSFLSLLGREFEKLRLENPSYEIYRIAGDEFVFCRTGPYSTKEVNDFARSIIAIFERPIHVEHQKISSSISIGISYSTYCEGMACEVCTGKCKKSLDLLLIEAEAAMYKVKSKGKNNYMLFDEYMNDEMQNKASILQDLTQAMANNELVLYYQPKFSLHEGRFNSFEALIRWRHPV
ncbi:MAG: diguanylate cyclase [Clostridiales bacterium]|nr:diguanylate cyclase [Clostridiales bacterium]